MSYLDDYIDPPTSKWRGPYLNRPKVHFRVGDSTLCGCEEQHSISLPPGRKSPRWEKVTCKGCIRLGDDYVD